MQAGSVGEGLLRTARLRPDSILAEIGFPDGDGFELTRRPLEQLPTVTVIQISTDSEAANSFAAERVGAAGFFPKDEILSDSFGDLIEEAKP
jgi:DNA-binding NarL/FixJ family response regulator